MSENSEILINTYKRTANPMYNLLVVLIPRKQFFVKLYNYNYTLAYNQPLIVLSCGMCH